MAALVAGALQRHDAVARAESAAAEVAVRAERMGVLLRELQHRAKNNLALVTEGHRSIIAAPQPRAGGLNLVWHSLLGPIRIARR
jgi:hypothetical protein